MLVLIISCGNIRLRCFWFKIQVLKFPFQFLPLEWLWKKINFQTVVADLLKYYESFRFFSSFVSLYQELFLILYRDINVWNNIRKKKKKNRRHISIIIFNFIDCNKGTLPQLPLYLRKTVLFQNNLLNVAFFQFNFFVNCKQNYFQESGFSKLLFLILVRSIIAFEIFFS